MKRLLLLFCLSVLCYSCVSEHEQINPQEQLDSFALIELHLITDTLPWKNKVRAKAICNSLDTLDLKFRLRGGGSAQFAKHNYLLEFKNKQRFSSGIFDDDIILTANYIDKTFLRHVLNYELFNAMDSVDKAPKTQFIWFKQNQEEKGLYVLMEKVNAGMLNLNKKDTSACLFKGTRFLTKEVQTVFQDPLNKYHQKFPDLKKRDKSYEIENLRNFILNSSDSVFLADFEAYFNLNNILDWYILLSFSNNHDGELKNFYLYKKDVNSPFLFSIWDCDDSFGRSGGNHLNINLPEVNMRKSILFDRLISHPKFKFEEQLNERYEKHKETLLNEDTLIQKIENYYQQLQPYLIRNAEIWPLDDSAYQDKASTRDEYDLLIKFIHKRNADFEARKSLIPLID